MPTFVNVTSLNANLSSFAVAVPSGTAVGDALILFFADNTDPTTAAITSPPSGGAGGWTLLQTVGTTNMGGRVWGKAAAAGDLGATITVTTAALVKADVTLISYTGVAASPFDNSALASEAVSQTTHTTPTLTSSGASNTLVSYWADKSSTASTIAVPGGVTGRASTAGTGGGKIAACCGDSAAAAGTVGGLVATSTVASSNALMVSVVLAAAGQTVAVGVATETDAAQPITRSKSKALGVATETDAAQPLAAAKLRPAGVAAETDAAQALGRSKSAPLGLALETDAALPVGAGKSRSLGIATETDVAMPIVRLVAAVDITLTIGPTRIRTQASIGPTRAATEVDVTRGGPTVDDTRHSTDVGPTRKDRGA